MAEQLTPAPHHPILTAFTHTPIHDILTARARNRMTRPPRWKENPTKWKGEFSGGIFERIAYELLRRRLPPDLHLLSPSETLERYRALLPGAKMDIRPFSDTLRGVPVPDGLLQRNPLDVRAVCEYTTRSRVRDIRAKYESVAKRQRRVPSHLRDLPWVLVTPSRPEQFTAAVEAIDPGNITVLTLPFTHGQFRHFVNTHYPVHPL